MATVPPTDAEIDAWADANDPFEFNGGFENVGQNLYVIGYTQFNGDHQFFYVPNGTDPTTDPGYSFQLQEVVSVYGAFSARAYTIIAPPAVVFPPAASMAMDSTEQARVNDLSNWLPVP